MLSNAQQQGEAVRLEAGTAHQLPRRGGNEQPTAERERERD